MNRGRRLPADRNRAHTFGVLLSWRVRIVVGATVAVLAASGVTAYALVGRSDPAATGATTVAVARGAVTVTASAAGTVDVVRTRGLSFGASGVVTELSVKVGDPVVPGQVLARVDAADAQDAVDAAQAQVDAAQDALTRAKATSTTSVCPAAYVSPSQSRSAEPSPSASTQPPTPRPTQTQTQPRACTTTNQAGRGGGDALSSAEQQLNNAELALSQAQRQLTGTVLTAPVAGRVVSVGGTVGTSQRPGGTGFVVLGDLADTAVKAEFSEADVAGLAVGQVAAITLPNRAEPLTGTVSQIDPVGTVSGRLVRYGVLVAFDKVPDGLLFGQGADVVVTTASVAAVLYVPTAAVTEVHDGSGVVTVRADGRDSRRTVNVGLRGDRFTEIRSGLDEGERVLV